MVWSLPLQSTVVLPLVLLASCVAGPELKTPFTAPANDYLAVAALHAYSHKEGLMIFGQVQASRSKARPVTPHHR